MNAVYTTIFCQSNYLFLFKCEQMDRRGGGEVSVNASVFSVDRTCQYWKPLCLAVR